MGSEKIGLNFSVSGTEMFFTVPRSEKANPRNRNRPVFVLAIPLSDLAAESLLLPVLTCIRYTTVCDGMRAEKQISRCAGSHRLVGGSQRRDGDC